MCPVNGTSLAPYYMGLKHTGELWVNIGTPLPNTSGNTGVMVCYANLLSEMRRVGQLAICSSLPTTNQERLRTASFQKLIVHRKLIIENVCFLNQFKLNESILRQSKL